MAHSITVAGTDRITLLLSGTLNFQEALGQRNTLACTFYSPDGSFIPKRGQEVVYHHDTLGDLFGGYIWTATWRKIGGDGDGVYTDCTCVSFEQMFDRRRCWEHTYTGNNFGEIVRDIVENSIGVGPFSPTDDAFTAALVADGGECVLGPSLDTFQVQEPRPTIRAALDTLCTYATVGTDIYYWDITPGKVVRAFIQGTYPAPFSITDGNLHGLLQECSVSEEIDGKANRVFVYLGKYLRDSAPETLHGDGSTRSFTLTYPVGAAPTITLNTATVTVGIDGVDTGKQYYWNLESNQIRQDAGETLLVLGDDLEVTYQGIDKKTLGPIEDGADVSAESTLQGGGTGYFEAYVESNALSGTVDAATLGNAFLDRVKRATLKFSGSTYTEGLRAGQEVTVVLAQLGLSADMLVQSVTMTDQGAGRLLWAFTAIDGPQRADWKQRLLGAASGTGSVTGGGVSGGGGGGGGSVTDAVTTISVDTTLSNGPEIVEIDSTSADVTATLQSAANMIGQRKTLWKVASAHNAVVNPAGTETIDGALSYTLTDIWETIVIEAISATEWKIVGNAVSVSSSSPTAPGAFTIGTVTAEWVTALAQ